MKKILSPICYVLPAITFLIFAFNEATLFGQPGGGPNTPDKKILKDFDADKDGVLNKKERAKARESLKANARGGLRGLFGGPPSRGPGDRGKGGDRGPDARRGKGGPGGGGPGGGGPGGFGRGGFRGGPPGGRGGRRPAGTEGPKVSPSEVKNYPNNKLYDTTVLRTIFLDFESDDWEAELTDFKPTDVEVPATVTVDGKKYPNVGVSFRGASSFFSIPSGSKRSLNLSMDYLDDKQKLYGYKTLNLLNCNGDASLMSSYLYAKIAGAKIATPKVNFVKVVINGRSWGVYANVQQFNKDFLKEFFDTKKGARWKVSGSPRGDAGLRYIGEDISDYRAKYEIKSKDKDESWKSLINLCKVLNETPTEDLEAALESILDIDGALWFLACDVALINSDGYWTRASDYSIYLDPKGKFHILPHDMNESFRASRSRGFGGLGGLFGGPPNRNSGRGRDAEPQGGQRRREQSPNQKRERPERNTPPDQDRRQASTVRGYDLDPMTGLSSRFPLRQKLLAVPSLKKKYLEYLQEIASKHIDWEHLGTEVKRAAKLIESEVEKDTRKLATFEEFQNSVSESDPPKSRSLQEFSVQRSKFLLNYPAIKELEKTTKGVK